MPSQATVTAKTGPNSQVTALVINPMSKLVLDSDRRILEVYRDNSKWEFDLTGVSTFTVTPSGSGSIYTVTIS